MVPVVAIVGLSSSGKTRVATAVIQLLVARGYRVAAIKHAAHGHQADLPHTDSARLFAGGATKVFVSSPGQLTSFERTEGDTSLEEVAGSLGPSYDLLVAEGFKASSAPKVLIAGEEALAPLPQSIIAVVSDHETHGTAAGNVPRYSFHELDGLADQIQRHLLRGRGFSSIR